MCCCSPECRKKHEAALVKIRKNLKWFAAGNRGVCPAGAAQRVCGRGGRRGGDSAFPAVIGMSLFGGLRCFYFLTVPRRTYAMFGYVRTTRLGRGMGNSRHPVRPVGCCGKPLIFGKYMIEMKRPSAGRISCPAKGRCYSVVYSSRRALHEGVPGRRPSGEEGNPSPPVRAKSGMTRRKGARVSR